MILHISKNYKTLSRETADLIEAHIINSNKKTILVCLASGHSPLGVFECMVQDVKLGKLSLSQCLFISLDEWLGFGADDDGSCRQMMDKDFFGPLQILENQIRFFDGLTTNPEQDCADMNAFINHHGGLDIMLVGIGLNGHIAMNEPGTPFETYAHVSTLAEETKSTGQKYFTKKTNLDKGLTLGLKHFAEAKLPILMANGEKKAAIISKIMNSPVDEKIPATIIHNIKQGYIMLDESAAGQSIH